jgi:hypothetical protein
VDVKYEWAKGQESRDKYIKWRNAQLLICQEYLVAGTYAVIWALHTSWWEWEDTPPFHWRWPLEYQERIRDGIRVHFCEEPPRYVLPHRDVHDPKIKEKVRENLQKIQM